MIATSFEDQRTAEAAEFVDDQHVAARGTEEECRPRMFKVGNSNLVGVVYDYDGLLGFVRSLRDEENADQAF